MTRGQILFVGVTLLVSSLRAGAQQDGGPVVRDEETLQEVQSLRSQFQELTSRLFALEGEVTWGTSTWNSDRAESDEDDFPNEAVELDAGGSRSLGSADVKVAIGTNTGVVAGYLGDTSSNGVLRIDTNTLTHAVEGTSAIKLGVLRPLPAGTYNGQSLWWRQTEAGGTNWVATDAPQAPAVLVYDGTNLAEQTAHWITLNAAGEGAFRDTNGQMAASLPPDVKVAIASNTTAMYLGDAATNGVLRVDDTLTHTVEDLNAVKLGVKNPAPAGEYRGQVLWWNDATTSWVVSAGVPAAPARLAYLGTVNPTVQWLAGTNDVDTDVLVSVSSNSSAAGYLGDSGTDGVLRVDSTLTYESSGDSVELGVKTPLSTGTGHGQILWWQQVTGGETNWIVSEAPQGTPSVAVYDGRGAFGTVRWVQLFGSNEVAASVGDGTMTNLVPPDEKISVVAGSTPGYLGADGVSGVLHTDSSIKTTPSLDNEYVTLGVDLEWLTNSTSWLTNGLGPGGVTNHNLLAGLQGGAAGEYFHLTLAEYREIVPAVEGDPDYVAPEPGDPDYMVPCGHPGNAPGGGDPLRGDDGSGGYVDHGFDDDMTPDPSTGGGGVDADGRPIDETSPPGDCV